MSRKSPAAPRKPRYSFKAFLSHRYKSPDINLYFLRLFAEIAEEQFEVDEGTRSTNVTRLERMVRGADAFIGIYPFSGTWEDSRSVEKLREASQYFRLELDLAVRSRKPAVVFYDERYGDLVKPPSGIPSRTFNAQEVEGSGSFPHADLHRKLFRDFCEVVAARRKYDVARDPSDRDCTGVIVPAGDGAYEQSHLDAITETMRDYGCGNVQVFKWPPVLDRQVFSSMQGFDMACVDIGAETAATGIPAYLHGCFVPSLRLKKGGNGDAPSPLERTLYGGVEVGYPKDILVWDDLDSLRQELKKRLDRIKEGVKLIGTARAAEEYFRSAALRKEAVFLSYSGKDEDVAVGIASALKRKFQEVFDYKDGVSIRPGQPWLKEIFDRLSKSAVGIPLISENYFQTNNCVHEAEEMVAQQDNSKMLLLPLKIVEEKVEIPPWLRATQFIRLSRFDGDPTLVVQEIVRLVQEQASKPNDGA
jgi:hypothetical protein